MGFRTPIEANLEDPSNFEALIRRLFRLDPYLHPTLATKFSQGKINLSSLQQKSLLDPEFGLIPHVLQHRKIEDASTPFFGLIALPVGIGKTVVALKYIELMTQIYGKKPTVIFTVNNSQILNDVWQKARDLSPSLKIQPLFSEFSSSELNSDVDLILTTRVTYHARYKA